jgi:hypothetical protein
MNFSLPKEFEQFVTSAEDLLKQFDGNLSNESVVNLSFHWDERSQSCPQFESAVRYHRLVSNQLEELSRGYVWHDEPFRLGISFDYKGVASLTGSAKIGECVDDEWFIVYLVLQISKLFPELIISVTDNDGQFMLMEAADHIDDWLGPENADNRVWIKEGLVHIIPYDEPGKLKSGGMKLNSALQCMFGASRTGVTLASEAFQRAIRARTTEVYPAKALADAHTAMCIVPRWLSELLQRHPNIVSRAVAAFCAADKDTLRKACTVVTTSNSISVTNTEAKLAQLTTSTIWVAVPVRFTRALYAQLTFKDNFNPPRKYHSVMRRMAAAQSRKVTHAFELGCRLTCGIDCALYACRGDKPARSGASDAVWQEVLTAAKKYSYLSSSTSTEEDTARVTELRRLFDAHQLMSAANLEAHRAGDSAYADGFAAFLHRELSAAQSGALVNTVQEAADTEYTVSASEEQQDTALFRAVHDGLPHCDGDDWLYLSPEELDRELQQRLDRFKAGSQDEGARTVNGDALTAGSQSSTGVNSVDTVNGLSAPDTASASDTAEGGTEDAAQLQRMLDGLKSFMAGSSDLDGVTPTGVGATKSVPSAKKDLVSPPAPGRASVGPAAGSGEAPVSGGLQLDYSLLNSLMQSVSLHADGTGASAAVGVPAASDVANSAGPDKDATPANNAALNVADDLTQYFTHEDLNDAQNRDSDDDSDDDNSDNEDEDQRGADSADKYLQQILAENAQRGNNSIHPSTSAANRGSGAGEGLVSKEPTSAGAVLGLGGGILRSGSGVAHSGDVAEDIDSDDEIVEVAPVAKPAPKPTSAATTQSAQQKTRPVMTAGNGTAGVGPKPVAAESAPWGDDSDDSDDMDGDDEEEEEDWDAKYDNLDPQTIREFQVSEKIR